MREELIEVVEKFIEYCDELYEKKIIEEELYNSLTKKKLDFLNNIKKQQGCFARKP